jgi:hypothetical protein
VAATALLGTVLPGLATWSVVLAILVAVAVADERAAGALRAAGRS